MNERRRPEHELLNGRLEALLRTLPEQEPPADLTRRIMAQVLDAEETPVKPRAQEKPPQPLPPWQLGLALAAASVLVVIAVVSSWPVPVELVLSAGSTLARTAGSALDWLYTCVRLLSTLLDNVGGAATAVWTVARAGTRAAAAAAGPLILPVAGMTVALQQLLWAMLRTRRDPG